VGEEHEDQPQGALDDTTSAHGLQMCPLERHWQPGLTGNLPWSSALNVVTLIVLRVQ
jgi:hypothetical protein